MGVLCVNGQVGQDSRVPKRSNQVDETANRLFFRFFQASNTLQTKATQALDEFGITSTQWSVLGALSRPQSADGLGINELSEYLLVSRQNLTGVLSRLEARNLIQRSTAPADRRARVVQLTDEGRTLWTDLTDPIAAFYASALEGFGDEDRAAFIRYITLIQRNMARA
jgi:MarR family transcriptional regulator, organic hydroperoxide resistance regulator